METPEAVNRLLHEIKKALKANDEIYKMPDFAEHVTVHQGSVREMEIEEALKNLIKAVINEQKESTS